MSISCQRGGASGCTHTTPQTFSTDQGVEYLRVELKVAAAVPQQVDLPLHLLVLVQSSLLLAMVVEEDGKVQVDQGVGPGGREEKNGLGKKGIPGANRK